MNIENLKRAQEYIKTIPNEQFSMYKYRSLSDDDGAECNSVGCIIGHCTSLDANNFNENFADNINDVLPFLKWSQEFFDLPYPLYDFETNPEPKDTENSIMWDYLFSDDWSDYKSLNTVDHAVYRMDKVIKGYKPFKINIEIDNELLLNF